MGGMSDQTDPKDPRAIVARAILQNGAMKVSLDKPFPWSSGFYMPVYVDNRCLIGYPEVRSAIADAFVQKIKDSGVKYDAIAGVATGAIPHATTLADKLGLPLLYIRPKPKDHGIGRQVEGDMAGGFAGKNILVIEDTVATGGSSMKAVEAMRKEGGIVSMLSAIYYHDLPGKENTFEKMTPPCTLAPLITFQYLLERAKEEKIFDEKTIAALEAWHVNPFVWGETNGFPQGEPK